MRLRRCLAIALLACALVGGSPALASAQIAFDAATDGTNNGGGTTSLSFNHTTSGSNRILFVGVIGDIGLGADDISGVTYNGDAMTLVDKVVGGSTNRNTYLYVLVNPDSGTNAVVVTAGSAHYLLAGALSYTGAAQAGQPDASDTQQDSGTTVTPSLTTVADNSWAVVVANGPASTPTPWSAGSGATHRTEDAAFHVWAMFDSGGAITPAGSYSMTAVNAQGGIQSGVMASFSPAGAAPPAGARSLALSGVGQ